jgi:hypothetical protein
MIERSPRTDHTLETCRRTNDLGAELAWVYMDQDMRLAVPKNKYQQSDADGWCPGAKIGELIDTALNPALWTRGKGSAPSI